MPTVIDLSSLGTRGFIIQGDVFNDFAGWSVSDAGDVNGDGFADVLVGARFGGDGGFRAGEAYLIFGKASGFGTVDLSTLTPAAGIIIQGDTNNDYAGYSVASAGDINGDGFDDIIVGANGGDNGGASAGEAYVVFGKASGFANIDLTALTAADGFTIQGDAAGDNAGISVASAGDINDDGFADIVIGAHKGDDGGSYAGEAYVIFGKASGFADIDLSALAAADGFIIQGDTADDRAGESVASAGDVNGDGFDDIIVGASTADNSGTAAGEAYVIFGKAAGFANIDLTGLAPADGFAILGDVLGDRVGHSVSSAGDINGDGFDDIVVGAFLADVGGVSSGEAYVIFGKGTAFSTIDLASLTAADGFAILGGERDEAGISVSSAGDVNGDGLADIIVGAGYGDLGGTFSGQAYVLFGKTSGFGTIDLTNFEAEDGFIVQGDSTDDRAGLSVSGAGDVNGDGLDDLIVGAPLGNDGGADAGEAYVIFGWLGDFPPVFDLSLNLTPLAGFIVQGDQTLDQAGRSVSGAGDVNGDGLDDFIVGAPFGDDGGANAGEAYVVFGRARGATTVDLTGLAPADGFIIQGDAPNDQAGFSVSAAGDVNNDGFADLIVGAQLGDDGGSAAGEDYVIFGKAGGFATIDLTGLAAADGFIIQGDTADDRAGYSVASAGDVNGDGFDDLVVGARKGDDGGSNAGEAYVIFGKAGGFGTIDLTGLAAADGFIIQGDTAGDEAGFSVSSAGDVNDDGYDDIVVGARLGDDGGGNAGEAYVIFGKGSGFANIDLSSLAAVDGFVIQGDVADDQAGRSVSSAGDVNGDGFGDLIVGAPFGDDGGTQAGEAYVLFGKASGFTTVDLTGLAAADGFVIQGDAAYDVAGFSVSSAGDVNGDGFDDLIVGAPLGDDGGVDAGEAYVIFGKVSGFATVDLTALTAADGFIIQAASAYDQAGFSVSAAGDVDGDGFDDILVGAPLGDNGGSNAGQAYVIFGRAPATPVTRTGSTADQTIRGGVFGDTLSGLDGGDALYGQEGDDALFGGEGNDLLIGSAGIDTTDGGAGDDWHFVDDGLDLVIEAAGGGLDRIYASVDYALAAGIEVETMRTVDDLATTAIDLTGNELDNDLVGNTGVNVLDGGTGGIDSLDGLGGNDEYYVDTGDVIIEAAAGDFDVARVRTTFVLNAGAQIETLKVTNPAGTGAIDVTGNEFDNLIVGNAGINRLDGGGGGIDTLRGLGGDDIYFVDPGDRIEETAGGGHDVVKARNSYVLSTGAEVEILQTSNSAGVTAMNLTGNELADRIIGNAGDNVLKGWLGSDVILGNGGADRFVFNAALGPDNIDEILDFAVGVDEIGLDDIVFGLTLGALPASAFAIGAAAGDADDRIVYDDATGALYFDSDGNGAGAAVQFALLDPGLALTASDFVVI